MGIIYDEELKVKLKERQKLVNTYTNKEIKTEEFDNKMKELDIVLNNIKQKILDTFVSKKDTNQLPKVEDNKIQQGEVKMAEDVKPAKVKRVSRTAVVLEVLQMKSIKNEDNAVRKLVEKLPGTDEKVARKHIKRLIGRIVRKEKRFAKYNFDTTNYLLTVTAQ
jgi:hypothetical protein